MSQPPDQQNLGLKIRGLVVLAATLVIIAIGLAIAYLVLGATFSAFDKMTNLLNPTALGVYTNLRSTVVGILTTWTIMIPLSALGILVVSIYKLRTGEEQ